ncbi:putative baseplate assembly protein [Nitrosospira multiformis]|uniref:Putative baseplate assembly protein n=1 Tax=Nitrosospira multiformis TaxID=1231 RepID=A0A1H8LEZ6_9PROT|nr:baseplate J/gp47 family protein [Nitrosospira multiformis]SEO03772.1 putative baseplate assembly protein [Nitrosospira multiformis]
MEIKDRKARLLESLLFNGIDFVEIANDSQTWLRVHFLNSVQLSGTISTPTITGGETIRTVSVSPVNDNTDWQTDGNSLILNLTVASPGDFSIYRLSISSNKLDPFFQEVTFSFKARCPSSLDCRLVTPQCPAEEQDIPPIDYLAKDFLSFRQALLDFSALRYPEWQERSEADVGVMFLEALSALADDLSYTQDRIAAEASLDTATQRRSLVRHARMVDYEPRCATASRVMLQFDVDQGVNSIAHGLAVTGAAPDGTPVVFETGEGLLQTLTDATGRRLSSPPTSIASSLWNAGAIKPYWFDDSERCLKAGATSMKVLGHGFNFQPNQLLLIETKAQTSADPPIRQIVQLTDNFGIGGPVEDCDFLFSQPIGSSRPPFMTCNASPPGPTAPVAFTYLRWRDADKLLVDHDLTRTTLGGNLVPATQGITVTDERFAMVSASPEDPTIPVAIVRTGPREAVADTDVPPPWQYLYSLKKAPLAWLVPTGPAADRIPLPEILLEQTDGGLPAKWDWLRRLLDAEQFANVFTLDKARYLPIGRNSDDSVQYEYDSDAGDTIRFGDGIFGEIPPDTAVFRVTYRVGGGAIGNIAADAVWQIDPAISAKAKLRSATNPFPASGGADEETAERVRRLAPQAFRTLQNRAVIPKDYQNAAEKLPWVQRAGTVFRWTGSWLTVFTTPDPLHSERITIDQRKELIDLLNRYRMAGYESYVPEPQYVSLDIEVQVCALPDAFQGDVQAAILGRLNSSSVVNGQRGFFNPDNFSFGVPLERSNLESAIQSAPGVAGVLCVRYRVRGRTQGMTEMPDSVAVAADQIIRCDNDPSVPEHGSIKVSILGGK